MPPSAFNTIIRNLIIVLLMLEHNTTNAISSSESDAARISMLEKALAPKTIDEFVSLFAKANKDRNGAVQFMLFSDELKNKYKNSWPYWVSGTSSPWITSYTIKKIVLKKDQWTFQITYQWATADGPFKPDLIQTIVVTRVPKHTNSAQKLWITHFHEH